jgi:hypothetical protein
MPLCDLCSGPHAATAPHTLNQLLLCADPMQRTRLHRGDSLHADKCRGHRQHTSSGPLHAGVHRVWWQTKVQPCDML